MVTGEMTQGEEGLTGPELTLTKGTTQAFVRPSEGGIVSRFRVDNADVFFQDQFVQTPSGPKRRGGNPLLFPNAGPVTEKSDEFTLPQHGFARDRKWAIKDMGANGESILLALTSNDQTKSLYPYDFEVELGISVDSGKLREELKVTNHSQKPMPIAPGFHPYFHVPIEERSNVQSNIAMFEPKDYDWAKALIFPAQSFVLIQIPSTGLITLKSSPEYKKLVVWSEPDRPHLCVEPWIGNINTILNPQERISLEPGRSTSLWIEIGFQRIP